LEQRWCPSYSLVTSRTALAGTDSVNWGTIGPQWTAVPNPFTILSTSGRSITVSKTVPDNFVTLVEKGPGYPSGEWIGNFAPGDAVLWTHDAGTNSGRRNPMNLNFGATAVAAGGAQIDLDIATGASVKFVAEVDAYDASGNLLASFTEKGVATTAADNSAIVIGISSSSANIYQIALSIKDNSNGEKGDFAINKFDFRTSALAATPAVGQPASALNLAPLASSLLGTGQPAPPAAPPPGPAAASAPTPSQVPSLSTSSMIAAVPTEAADVVFARSSGTVTDDNAWLFESLSGQAMEGI
jgi:hypothetical protein